MSDPARGGTSRAMLVNGQWTMDIAMDAKCQDGTSIDAGQPTHFTWDPNTLAGTAQATTTNAFCGEPAGYTQTNNLQLTQAP